MERKFSRRRSWTARNRQGTRHPSRRQSHSARGTWSTGHRRGPLGLGTTKPKWRPGSSWLVNLPQLLYLKAATFLSCRIASTRNSPFDVGPVEFKLNGPTTPIIGTKLPEKSSRSVLLWRGFAQKSRHCIHSIPARHRDRRLCKDEAVQRITIIGPLHV